MYLSKDGIDVFQSGVLEQKIINKIRIKEKQMLNF